MARRSIVVVEHKTTSKAITPGSAYWRRLALDGQCTEYVEAASRLTGEPVDTVIYDVVSVPFIEPYTATPPEKIRYKADGTPYAGTRTADETPEEFRERVLEKLLSEPGRYYVRNRVNRTASDISDHRSNKAATAKLIAAALRDGQWPQNTAGCEALGELCDYFDACANRTRPGEGFDYAPPERTKRGLPILRDSHSARALFFRCPRAFMWRYVEGYRSQRSSRSATRGKLFHEALDAVKKGGSAADAIGRVGELCTQKEYAGITPHELALVEALLIGYFAAWRDQQLAYSASEQKYTHKPKHSRARVEVGVIDGIATEEVNDGE